MQSPLHYGVDEPTVIHECVDGEVLIVNLKHGAYFSLLDGAGAIWNALVAGASPEATVDLLEQGFDAPREVLAAAVSGFIADLLRES